MLLFINDLINTPIARGWNFQFNGTNMKPRDPQLPAMMWKELSKGALIQMKPQLIGGKKNKRFKPSTYGGLGNNRLILQNLQNRGYCFLDADEGTNFWPNVIRIDEALQIIDQWHLWTDGTCRVMDILRDFDGERMCTKNTNR
jgi:hypothetical protein